MCHIQYKYNRYGINRIVYYYNTLSSFVCIIHKIMKAETWIKMLKTGYSDI